MLTEIQNQMVYWITERESIRKKKESGITGPWSSDRVMQETYFCNVNREDDKVTRWIRTNWLYPEDELGNDTSEFFDFAMIVARIFNWPPTLDELRQPIDTDLWLEHAAETLFDIKSRGDKIWNGAYIISTNGNKMDKISYCLTLLSKLRNRYKITEGCLTLREAHSKLMGVEGLGSFLAAQVVADLKNTKGHPLMNAQDWYSFSAYGPGSLRGLSWFFEEKITPKTYDSKIKHAYEILEFELPEPIMKILCFQNLQNCFCEFDKFMRVSTGSGRSKRKYEVYK